MFPPFVVLRIRGAPPSASPTAKQFEIDGHATENRNAIGWAGSVCFTHVLPPSDVAKLRSDASVTVLPRLQITIIRRFLNLSARMSRTLGAADDATLGVAVVSVLEDLASWAGADCASVTLVDQADRVSDDWHWFRPELDPVAPAIGAPLAETFGSALEFLKVGHTVAIDDIDALELSPEERRMATRNDLRALVIAPVRIAGVFLGVVGLHVFGRPHVWEPRVVNRDALGRLWIGRAALRGDGHRVGFRRGLRRQHRPARAVRLHGSG